MVGNDNLPELLDNEQTAELLGIKPNTLEIWRVRGRGPAFVKFGSAKQCRVRYQRTAVMRWLHEQSFASTSGYSHAQQPTFKRHNCGSN